MSGRARDGSRAAARPADYYEAVRGRLFAGTGCVILLILLALAGCDVRIRPVYSSPGVDAAILDCPPGMVGFATAPSADGAFTTTTGGGAAPPVTVDAADPRALDQFKTYADRKTGSAVIEIRGLISFAGSSSSQIRVASNTTVLGMDSASGFTGGGLDLNGSRNVIIKNLTIAKATDTDAITIQGPDATNIWIDHCDLSSEWHADGASYDGLVDITHAADWITVSWTRFHDHRDTGIVGHSDSNGTEDTGHLHVTYEHDLFQRVDAGPRVRFGTVHVFNVFFDQVTYYGVASTMSAHVRVESSFFRDVTAAGLDPAYGPITTRLPESDPTGAGFVDLVNNLEERSGAPDVTAGQIDPWDPLTFYKYTADAPTSAPALVQSCAGPRPTVTGP